MNRSFSRACLLCLIVTSCASCAGCAATSPRTADDRAYRKLADEYLAGYLAWRPQEGVALGLHEYDGKVSDLGRTSIDRDRRLRHNHRQVRPVLWCHLVAGGAEFVSNFDIRISDFPR